MNQSRIKGNIACLTEEIIKRTRQINQSGIREALLDIDMMMQDLRQLYREYESLRVLAANGHNQNEELFHEPRGLSEETKTENQSNLEDVPQPPPPEVPQRQPWEVPSEQPGEVPGQPEEVPPRHQPVPELPPEPETPEQEPEPAPAANKAEAPLTEPEPEPLKEEKKEEAPEKPNIIEEQQQEPVKEVPKHEPEENNQQTPGEPGMPDEKTAEHVVQKRKPQAIIDLFSQPAEKAIGDHYTTEDNSLHQRISKTKTDYSIGTRMQQTPVDNIKTAIGVNDKFLFINELFHGNIQLYNEAIDVLNKQQDMQQAFDYLNELSSRFTWDQNRSGETIEKLANFVQRRYLKA